MNCFFINQRIIKNLFADNSITEATFILIKKYHGDILADHLGKHLQNYNFT